MLLGYARVTTNDQDLTVHKNALIALAMLSLGGHKPVLPGRI